MSIIEVVALAKTFKIRERAAGLSGSLHSFIAPRYRKREAVKLNLVGGETTINVDPTLLCRALSLVLENAMKHAGKSSAIDIDYGIEKSRGFIRVREDVLEGLRKSLPHEIAMANAPETDGIFFKVPKVIER